METKWRFLIIFFLLTILTYKYKILAVIFLILIAFILYFFRDPKRKTPQIENSLISPADGRVIDITLTDDSILIRIFLSIFDVHIQRAPVDGFIEDIYLKEGSFLDARHPLAHKKNFSNTIILNSQFGKIKIKQIAGIIARRIACWVKKNQNIKKGEKIGLIYFGSQVDIEIPKNIILTIKKQDKVYGGLTVLGEFKNE